MALYWLDGVCSSLQKVLGCNKSRQAENYNRASQWMTSRKPQDRKNRIEHTELTYGTSRHVKTRHSTSSYGNIGLVFCDGQDGKFQLCLRSDVIPVTIPLVRATRAPGCLLSNRLKDSNSIYAAAILRVQGALSRAKVQSFRSMTRFERLALAAVCREAKVQTCRQAGW